MHGSTNFKFDGITSESKGVLFCKYKDQNISEIFVSGRELVTEQIQTKNKIQNYLFKINKQPHHFKIELYHELYNDEKQREIARWFFNQNTYKPFQPMDTQRIYYILPIGTPEFETNGSQGIISFDVETKDCYSYSGIYTINYDYSTSTTPQTIQINNFGDVETFPILNIEVIENGSTITFQNTTNSGKTFSLSTNSSSPLVTGEIIKVNMETESITTNQLGLFRYENMSDNSEFWSLVRGINNIIVTGKVKLFISYQFKYLL